jgi:opacity protein-like surface antigen
MYRRISASSSLVIALTLMVTPMAHAQLLDLDENGYVAVRAGGSFVGDSELAADLDPMTVPSLDENELEFENSYTFAGSVGYDLPDSILRPEFEVSYFSSDVDSFKVDGVRQPAGAVRGDLETLNFLGNLYVDIPLDDRWDVFLGGGAGASIVTADFGGTGLGVLDLESEDDMVLAYQFLSGVAWHFDEKRTLELSYRAWNSQDPNYDFGDLDSPLIQTVQLGFRMNF